MRYFIWWSNAFIIYWSNFYSFNWFFLLIYWSIWSIVNWIFKWCVELRVISIHCLMLNVLFWNIILIFKSSWLVLILLRLIPTINLKRLSKGVIIDKTKGRIIYSIREISFRNLLYFNICQFVIIPSLHLCFFYFKNFNSIIIILIYCYKNEQNLYRFC